MSATKRLGEPKTAKWRWAELHLTVCVYSLIEFENGSHNMTAIHVFSSPPPTILLLLHFPVLEMEPWTLHLLDEVLYSPAPNYHTSVWNWLYLTLILIEKVELVMLLPEALQGSSSDFTSSLHPETARPLLAFTGTHVSVSAACP